MGCPWDSDPQCISSCAPNKVDVTKMLKFYKDAQDSNVCNTCDGQSPNYKVYENIHRWKQLAKASGGGLNFGKSMVTSFPFLGGAIDAAASYSDDWANSFGDASNLKDPTLDAISNITNNFNSKLREIVGKNAENIKDLSGDTFELAHDLVGKDGKKGLIQLTVDDFAEETKTKFYNVYIDLIGIIISVFMIILFMR